MLDPTENYISPRVTINFNFNKLQTWWRKTTIKLKLARLLANKELDRMAVRYSFVAR